jgi:hypothetical protein
MLEASQSFALADQQQLRVRVLFQETAARGQRDAGAVIAPHAVHSKGDHERSAHSSSAHEKDVRNAPTERAGRSPDGETPYENAQHEKALRMADADGTVCIKTRPGLPEWHRTGRLRRSSGFGLGLEHLAPTVETVGADVVAQMGFTRGRLDGQTGRAQRIVGTVHATLGRRLLVLLNGHDGLLGFPGQDALSIWKGHPWQKG